MEKSYPTFSVDAVPHKDVGAASRVFSISEVDYFLFVRIPAHIAKDYELYQVDEVLDDVHFVCHRYLWEHQPGRIWYRFKFHMLNEDVGLHTYRLGFVNTHTGDTLYLFFGYVIQNNHPDQPYKYMNSREGGACGCGSTDTSEVDKVQC